MTSGVEFGWSWGLGLVVAAGVAGVAYRVKMLTFGGAVAAFCVGWIIFSLGGLTFSIPVIAFFVSSNLLSRRQPSRRSEIVTHFQKGERRDHRQVLANGLVATVFVIVWSGTGDGTWAWLFLVALAGATADTWATELGLHSRAAPRSILTFGKVPAGTSGGITLLGLAAALTGAVVIALTGSAVFRIGTEIPVSYREIVLVTVVGFGSQILDSLLGAGIQAQYRCPGCGRLTERKVHCAGFETTEMRGVKWVDNDVVNFGAIVGGVSLGWIWLTVFP